MLRLYLISMKILWLALVLPLGKDLSMLEAGMLRSVSRAVQEAKTQVQLWEWLCSANFGIGIH